MSHKKLLKGTKRSFVISDISEFWQTLPEKNKASCDSIEDENKQILTPCTRLIGYITITMIGFSTCSCDLKYFSTNSKS